MSQHGTRSEPRFVSPTRGGATLTSLVAAQRSQELDRLVETHSRVALALNTGHYAAGRRGWGAALNTLVASAQHVGRGVAALRPRLAHGLDAHASRADARARTAPSGPDSQLVCCA